VPELVSNRRRKRADAERSITAVLDAAVVVLGERPHASIEDVAKAAGLTRQTVYAHFPSRDALLGAVTDRALAETLAAIDEAEIDRGPAGEALDRLVDASWQTLERYPLLMDLRAPLAAEEGLALHRPILERLERLVKRGQRAGEFELRLPPTWLLASFLALAHTAAEEVRAGRMSAEEAAIALKSSVARVFATSG
jgi:AcrR family transcriptional regulator